MLAVRAVEARMFAEAAYRSICTLGITSRAAWHKKGIFAICLWSFANVIEKNSGVK